jgi:glucan phosphoethanolaminetransferase (alkaline phosphatase superfamily)
MWTRVLTQPSKATLWLILVATASALLLCAGHVRRPELPMLGTTMLCGASQLVVLVVAAFSLVTKEKSQEGNASGAWLWITLFGTAVTL